MLYVNPHDTKPVIFGVATFLQLKVTKIPLVLIMMYRTPHDSAEVLTSFNCGEGQTDERTRNQNDHSVLAIRRKRNQRWGFQPSVCSFVHSEVTFAMISI